MSNKAKLPKVFPLCTFLVPGRHAFDIGPAVEFLKELHGSGEWPATWPTLDQAKATLAIQIGQLGPELFADTDSNPAGVLFNYPVEVLDMTLADPASDGFLRVLIETYERSGLPHNSFMYIIPRVRARSVPA